VRALTQIALVHVRWLIDTQRRAIGFGSAIKLERGTVLRSGGRKPVRCASTIVRFRYEPGCESRLKLAGDNV
jgi:hypothetical protein